jgi:hypothetical protein
MMRFVEMGVTQAAAGESDRGAGAGFAEGDVGASNADGSGDSAFAEVYADAGEEFDRAVEAETHGRLSRYLWSGGAIAKTILLRGDSG